MEQLISDAERSDLRHSEKAELILRDNPGRWVLLPVEFPTLWEYYKKIERAFWTPEDFKWKQELSQLTLAGIGKERLAVLLRLAVYYNTVHGFPLPTRPNRSQVSSPAGTEHATVRGVAQSILWSRALRNQNSVRTRLSYYSQTFWTSAVNSLKPSRLRKEERT
eukprot:Protomagalhaensia_sp_Gyna_25__1074@NODE_1520_length_1766_cov_146_901563_g1234_i0_p2_GENE_NODE_1520_length_1766_cov_146_901563_g1234_i0NODE_1520_length_1766_cov_146_901563_g1234_i0_p2_ORF_typecomplete_len164_score17_81Ribonuc_red_sm/PF00268_21/4_2e05_NODE_1520_length_1766_cov_146_901563_g1234_i012081699